MKNTLFLWLLVINSISYAQWPQFRGPMRDGFSTETNLLKTWPAKGPELIWSSDIIGEGFSSAIIQNENIYVTGRRDSFAIITSFTLNGNLKWQKSIGKVSSEWEWGESSTPTFYKGKLYTLTIIGDICCIDSKTGDLDWSINIPDKFGAISSDYYIENLFCESPLVVDDKVIITPGGNQTTLVALNCITGETIWMSESFEDRNSFVSPVLVQNSDKKLIVTRTKDNVLAVDVSSGKIEWREKVYSVGFVPLPNNNQVFFPQCMMLNISNDLSSFKALWGDTLEMNVWGGAVKLGNRIFGTYETAAGIFCRDWETGKQLFFNNEIRGANLLAADGMIYSYEDKRGRVSLLKPTENNIEIVGSFKVKKGEGANLAHMSIANGILFIRHGSALMAYDIKQKFTDLKGDYLGQTPPGDSAEVFARNIISDKYQQHGVPTFSPDGKEVFWQTNHQDENNNWIVECKTMKMKENLWTTPAVSTYTGGPAFSADGKRVYFDCEGEGKDPYFIEKLEDGWSERKYVKLVSKYPEIKFAYNLSVSKEGSLYFLGYAEELNTFNHYGIYRSEFKDGNYLKPELLPETINKSGDYLNWTPFVAPDESYLLFCSRKLKPTDDYGDLYVCFRKKDGSWTGRISLGTTINSQGQERFPRVSPDNKYLFFARWTPDYDEDVFWASSKIIDEIRKEVLKIKK